MKKIKPNEVHIWSGGLNLDAAQIQTCYAQLNKDEKERADRFVSPIHRQHFIAARAMLRNILSQYTKVSPETVEFGYSEHQKPFLATNNPEHIEFNLSHSQDKALLALNLNYPIGIDIEKMRDTYNPAIVDRYFSPEEKTAFNKLQASEKLPAFYRVWVRKEAIVKAIGKGLYISLAEIDISINKETEMLETDKQIWFLSMLKTPSPWQAALACHPDKQMLTYFEYVPA